MSTGPANSDNPLSRPLGYRVKSLTLFTAQSNAKNVNTDSVYVDLEEWNQLSPNGLAGPVEIPPGFSVTWQEIDPGWLHFGSPTANQILYVIFGGPTSTAKA